MTTTEDTTAADLSRLCRYVFSTCARRAWQFYHKPLRDPEDVAQAAWFEWLRSAGREPGAMDRLRGGDRDELRRLGNACGRALRRVFPDPRGTPRPVMLSLDSLPHDPAAPEKEAARELRELLDDCAGRRMEPFEWCVLEMAAAGMTPAETAARLGTYEKAVRRLFPRAVARVRELAGEPASTGPPEERPWSPRGR